MLKHLRISFSWALLAALFVFLNSCTEEVEVNTIGPATNIVYGLLNPDEEVQYVRVGRSYNGSRESFDVSPHPDSISWKEEFNVYIEEWGENQDIINVFQLDQDNEIVKDSGFFPIEGLAVFKASFVPKPGNSYAVYVHFVSDDKISNGWTTMPGDVLVHDPKPIPERKINLQTGAQYTIRWEPGENTGVYQTFFKIIYQEKSLSGVSFNDIRFNSQIFTEFGSSGMFERTVNGNRFFEECISQVDSTVVAEREVVNMTFELLIGGEEYGLYLFSQTNGNSLSSAFSEYTNIVNGTGIFSSLISYKVINLELSNTTLDELAYGDKTRHLGFLDHYGKRE